MLPDQTPDTSCPIFWVGVRQRCEDAVRMGLFGLTKGSLLSEAEPVFQLFWIQPKVVNRGSDSKPQFVTTGVSYEVLGEAAFKAVLAELPNATIGDLEGLLESFINSSGLRTIAGNPVSTAA